MDLMIAFLMYLQVLFPQDSGQYTVEELDALIHENIEAIEAVQADGEAVNNVMTEWMDDAQAFEEWEPPVEKEPIWE
jgi:hypothetical protein